MHLLSLFPPENKDANRGLLYDFAQRIFDSQVQEKKKITYDDQLIWIEADKIIVTSIVNSISACKNVNTFIHQYNFGNAAKALDWLNEFVNYLIKTGNDHYLNITETPILPNQDNYFLIKDILFLDDGTTDEKLKDIAEKVGFPIRADLLNKKIFLSLPANRVLSRKVVADKITALILPKLSELPRTEETKEVFRLIYLWFREKREIAELIFGELFISRHKLYDDEEVADNMQKAEDLKQLMEEFEITTVGQLRDIINNAHLEINNNASAEVDAQPITRESLVSLGIGSFDELEEALKDVNLAKVFLHNSVPTVEMFEYAGNLIKRAKKNILAYLDTLEEYDCNEVDFTAPTILAGIKYKGSYIDVVARPSDNGEVIIYYSSEKDVLEIPESQLWIDNNIDNPQLLSLGKILKVTGITKIPIQ